MDIVSREASAEKVVAPKMQILQSTPFATELLESDCIDLNANETSPKVKLLDTSLSTKMTSEDHCSPKVYIDAVYPCTDELIMETSPLIKRKREILNPETETDTRKRTKPDSSSCTKATSAIAPFEPSFSSSSSLSVISEELPSVRSTAANRRKRGSYLPK